MIDIEAKVYTRVKNAIVSAFPSAFVSGEYVRVVPSFPAVTIMEQYNNVYQQASELANIEKAVSLMYEVNVYSNLESGKKSQCKAILNVIDNNMMAMGFIRTECNPITNLNDATIYRIVARYEKIETN